MRRKEREISDVKEIAGIIEACQVLRVAVPFPDAPYIVPLNFGYESTEKGGCFYFHSAVEGRKIEGFREYPRVGFELDRLLEIVEKEKPCGWTAHYESVIGTGVVKEITELSGKQYALSRLMEHYGWEGEAVFPPEMLAKTSVWKLEVQSLSAKRNA